MLGDVSGDSHFITGHEQTQLNQVCYFHIVVVFLASKGYTVKILKIGTPEIITIIVLQMEQLDFTVQYCV